jgi:CRISPR/Cas system endoribonuclease Cas6 (RAMP superfamily)
MNNTSASQRHHHTILTAFFVGCLCLSGQAFSADITADSTRCESTTAQYCQEIQQQKQTMNDDINLQNKELSEQITTMNLAPKDQKMELMAGVITNLLRQRMVMDARRAQMEEKMMAHLMTHISPNNKALNHCPMMPDKTEIKSEPIKSGATHNEPRQENK